MCLVGLLGVAFGAAGEVVSGEEQRLLQGLALVVLVAFLASFYFWWKAVSAAIRFVLMLIALGAALSLLKKTGLW